MAEQADTLLLVSLPHCAEPARVPLYSSRLTSVWPGSPPGDVPPLDSDMAGAADIELKKENNEKAVAKEGEQKAGIKKKRQSKKFSVYDDGKSSDDVPH